MFDRPTAIELLKKLQSPWISIKDVHLKIGASAEETVDARRRAAELWRAIDALPEKFRIVTVLAAIEGHDLAEVAALLHLPVGTVKSRLFLARRRLKEQLQWTR